MATSLQVTANTSSAVGAFNQLANSIANARGQFNNLNTVINNGAMAARTYGNAITENLTRGFDKLASAVGFAKDLMIQVATVLGLVFTSVIRELDKLQGFNAIMSVTTKSADEASAAYDYLRITADRLGIQFDAVTSNYAKLVAAIPDGADKIRIAENVFLGISMAARTLHSSNADIQLMFYAITQMASKGVVSMEELRRQLGEKLPGVMQIAAKSLNTTPELFEAAVRKGVVNSEKFLNVFGDALIRTFADSSEKASTSVSASINRLTNVWVDFVKVILDSGAGQSIANIFDAIREKVSDTYVMDRFALVIKNISDEFTDFVKSLTADDVRNGFDTAQKFIEVFTATLNGVVTVLSWIINNAPKAGAIMGAMAGAAAGAVAGPYGMLAGAVGGAGLGYAAGKAVEPSPAQVQAREISNTQARQTSFAKAIDKQSLLFDRLVPVLNRFDGVGTVNRDAVRQPIDMANAAKSVSTNPGYVGGLDKLFTFDRLNDKTVREVVDILNDTSIKSDKARTEALLRYAKTSSRVSDVSSYKLNDVLGAAKPKEDSRGQKSIEGTLWQSRGFDRNFGVESANLDKLLKTGRMTLEEYQAAYLKLFDKQPFREKQLRDERKAQDEYNKGLNDFIDTAINAANANETIRRDMADDLKIASLRADDRAVEIQSTAIINKLLESGWTLREGQNDAIREQSRLTLETYRVTSAQDQIVAETVDRYSELIRRQQALDVLVKDPKSGVTNVTARDVTVNSDQNFTGSVDWISAQQRQLTDYYAYINGLRQRDRISEESANMAKSRSALDSQAKIRDAYIEAAKSRVEMGSTGWIDNAIAALGRLASGFRTFAGGANEAFGNFFQSFTDGFANSVGRAIIQSENLNEALKNVTRDALSGLISSLVKLGIQWLTNKLLGDSIATASAASSTAIAVTTGAAIATAYAPAAAMVSLATMGANAIPAAQGIAFTTALSAALAVGGGFAEGGYTGDVGRAKVAGFVHGQEYVINADATSKYRPLLEAINSGTLRGLGYMDGGYVGTTAAPVANQTYVNNSVVGQQSTTIIIENHGAEVSTQESIRPDGSKEVRFVVKAAVAETVRQVNSNGALAQAMRNNGVDMRSRLARRG
jgi:tape measure domain-containing protein